MVRYQKYLNAAIIYSFSFVALAAGEGNWTLSNDDSRLSFVSTKIKDVPEIHYFERMSGSISETGEVSINIAAESINTALELRDDRMKEFLFKVVDFPSIGISANVDMNLVSDLTDGESIRTSADTILSMMGKEFPVKVELLVTRAGDVLRVSSDKPVLVNATVLGLTEGMAKLAELAGGIEISNGVPVFFNLSFTN